MNRPDSITSTSTFRAAEELSQCLHRGNFRRAAELLSECPAATRGDIHLAAMAADIVELERLLRESPSLLEARDPRHDVTPLLCVAASRIHACGPDYAERQLRCAMLLIESGAELDVWQSLPPTIDGLDRLRRSALALAIGSAEFIDLAQLLLDAGCSVSDPEAVRCAAGLQDPAFLSLLLDRGADPNAPRALHRAIAAEALDGIDLLIQAGAGVRQLDSHDRTPLHLAVERELPPDVVQALLRAGVDADACDERGHTAYRMCVRQGSQLQARLLEDAGCDTSTGEGDKLFELCSMAQVDRARNHLSTHPELFDAISDPSENLLVETMRHRRHASAFAMLELGFDVDAQPEGEAALHIAAESGDIEGIKMLIQHGADLGLHDAAGRTPLARVVRAAWNRPASIRHLRETVMLLLSEGAQPEAWMPMRSEAPIAELFARAA